MDLKEYYHKLDYSYPKNENQIFEVCLASILTQNRSFKQVVQSLENLRNADVLDYKKIKNLTPAQIVVWRGWVRTNGSSCTRLSNDRALFCRTLDHRLDVS